MDEIHIPVKLRDRLWYACELKNFTNAIVDNYKNTDEFELINKLEKFGLKPSIEMQFPYLNNQKDYIKILIWNDLIIEKIIYSLSFKQSDLLEMLLNELEDTFVIDERSQICKTFKIDEDALTHIIRLALLRNKRCGSYGCSKEP